MQTPNHNNDLKSQIDRSYMPGTPRYEKPQASITVPADAWPSQTDSTDNHRSNTKADNKVSPIKRSIQISQSQAIIRGVLDKQESSPTKTELQRQLADLKRSYNMQQQLLQKEKATKWCEKKLIQRIDSEIKKGGPQNLLNKMHY